MPKKIKVVITKKVHSYRYGDEVFKPGDTLEILPQYFRADFMTKVVPPERKAIEVISEKLVEEVEEAPEVPTEVPGEGAEKKPGEKKKKRW